MQILVDTCVWRHWFTLKSAPERLDAKIWTLSESFNEIYCLATSHPKHVTLLFNALVQYELGNKFSCDFEKYITPVAKKIPIPLSRCDGLHKADGSILHGGRMGGSLEEFLTADGYQQSANIFKEAHQLAKDQNLYQTKPRIREFDVEHMESALEAHANLFLTNDESTIIKRLERMAPLFDHDHPINLIASITKTTTTALLIIKTTITSQKQATFTRTDNHG